MKFTHLHTHSHYSLLDGLAKIDDLVNRAGELGMDSLAVTDHGVMYGALELYQKAKKAGIKPVIGVEAYVASRSRLDKTPSIDNKRNHLILLAKNEVGYKNLVKLTTLAHLEGFYYKPRMDKEILRQYSEGIIASSACIAGEVSQAILENDLKKAERVINEFQEIFGKENYYLELQDHPDLEGQTKVNNALVELSKTTGARVVAANDIHYVYKDDDKIQDILLCIQMNKTVQDTDRMSMIGENYSMKSPEEMLEHFKHVPEAIDNTQRIVDACNVEFDLGGILIPYFECPNGMTDNEYLEKMCRDGIPKRYGKSTEEIEKRLRYELGVIKQMGFPSYFLIVQDFINWAKNNGVVVGPGRGSAAGSIVSYLTGITEIDPLKYNLLFERFLNPDRISMPDIDTDFADTHRDDVLAYVARKYGQDHVAQIITFGTMAAKAAVRDCGRALALPYSYCDKISKMIPMFTKLGDAMANTKELKDIYENDPDAKKLLDYSLKLEGVARHNSTHACGVVISKEPINNYTPTQHPPQDDTAITTQYAAGDIEKLGLLKMDFLGLKNLTIIERALRIISKTKKVDVDIAHLPLDDQKTFELFQKGMTTGVFQFESSGMKKYLKRLAPTDFEDIIAMAAMYRPGPLNSGMVDEFIERKHGRKKIVYKHPAMENALKNTYGIIIYQEQVMQLSKDMAGFTGGQADTLRKAMGKKIAELMAKMKPEFVNGCVAHKIDKKIAEETFGDMETFAEYGFNRSHAVCYAFIGHQTAYLKAHYPAEFMAALLTSDRENIDRVAIEAEECRMMNIEVLPPDVNESFVDFGVIPQPEGEKEKIRFGLSAIKNVGEQLIETIVEERKANGKFKDVEDFVLRVKSNALNKKSMESLARAGAFDSLVERNVILVNVEKILLFAKEEQKAADSGQFSLFASAPSSAEAGVNTLQLTPPEKAATKTERMTWEKELLGLYVSDHPLKEYAAYLQDKCASIGKLRHEEVNQVIQIAGIITKVQKIFTRNGSSMLFVNLEDLTGKIEILVFPKVLGDNPDVWEDGTIISARGKLSDKDGVFKLLGEEARRIDLVEAREYSEKHKSKSLEEAETINIRIPRDNTKKTMMELSEFLKNQADGKFNVCISVPAENNSYKKIKANKNIDCDDKILDGIKNIVTPQNVVLN
ncbi:MAG: DNA polymerase III subunit alpha [Proteiniphilum sp.]|nr:DNA polymerase III subunit alpha [Proteiniphilum sp.]